MLHCDKITCERGGRVLFKNLSLKMGMGELIVVRGANGSGKTTLLKIAAGLYPPQGGTVTWDKADVRKDSDDFRLFCTYIGHKTGMKSLLTVFENLSFYADMYETQELLPAAISYFKLEPYADKSFGTLSQGWQRKVVLSRLILTEGLLWLLDEPWANLDDDGSKRLTDLIKARVEQGGLVVVAAHGEIPLKAKKEINLSKEAKK